MWTHLRTMQLKQTNVLMQRLSGCNKKSLIVWRWQTSSAVRTTLVGVHYTKHDILQSLSAISIRLKRWSICSSIPTESLPKWSGSLRNGLEHFVLGLSILYSPYIDLWKSFRGIYFPKWYIQWAFIGSDWSTIKVLFLYRLNWMATCAAWFTMSCSMLWNKSVLFFRTSRHWRK